MHEKNSSPARSVDYHLARLQSLRLNRAHRDRTQFFVVEGIRQFIQACDAGFDIAAMFVSPILLRQSMAQKLVRRMTSTGVPKISLSPEQFRSISTTQHASGIAAIARQRWTPLEELSVPGLGWLVVDTLRSAGNLGTILRTAEATGMTGVIFVSDAIDPFSPAVVRASMGGIFHIPMTRTTPRELGYWLAAHRIDLIGLSPQAPRLWTDLPTSVGGHAIAVGDERDGLSPPLRRLCDVQVKLPMFSPSADSLNVAVAAGVMMYELVRRGMT